MLWQAGIGFGLVLQCSGQLRVTFPTADRSIHRIEFPYPGHQARALASAYRGDGDEGRTPYVPKSSAISSR